MSPRLLVGRQRETDLLTGVLAADGGGAVLLILGEPGIGKSALLAVADSQARPAAARCCARSGWSPRPAIRSPACTSCWRRCCPGPSGCRRPGATRCWRRSAWTRRRRRIRSRWPRPRSSCWPRPPPNSRWRCWPTTCSGWTRRPRRR
ncbi:AAA family ATPase [Catenulispora yoronensis]